MNRLGPHREIAALALLALALAGCSRKPGAAQAEATSAYTPPPVVETATRLADGSVHLGGHAPSSALIRMRSPDGGQITARAGEDGAWGLDLTPADTPRLYAFEALTGAQVVRGEGALTVLPSPAPVALVLRAGFAAQPVGAGEPGRLRLTSLDYDGGGVAGGGFAPAKSRVRMAIDGVVVGVTEADRQGRFSILAVDPGRGGTAGPHQVKIETPQGLAVDRPLAIAAVAIPQDRAFLADRGADGWTVSWRLPGGGVQTSLILDNAVGSPPPTPTP